MYIKIAYTHNNQGHREFPNGNLAVFKFQREFPGILDFQLFKIF